MRATRILVIPSLPAAGRRSDRRFRPCRKGSAYPSGHGSQPCRNALRTHSVIPSPPPSAPTWRLVTPPGTFLPIEKQNSPARRYSAMRPCGLALLPALTFLALPCVAQARFLGLRLFLSSGLLRRPLSACPEPRMEEDSFDRTRWGGVRLCLRFGRKKVRAQLPVKVVAPF